MQQSADVRGGSAAGERRAHEDRRDLEELGHYAADRRAHEERRGTRAAKRRRAAEEWSRFQERAPQLFTLRVEGLTAAVSILDLLTHARRLGVASHDVVSVTMATVVGGIEASLHMRSEAAAWEAWATLNHTWLQGCRLGVTLDGSM